MACYPTLRGHAPKTGPGGVPGLTDADWAVLEAARKQLDGDEGRWVAAVAQSSLLRGLVRRVLTEWAIPYGSRRVRLDIEYQDGRPVLATIQHSPISIEKFK